MYLGAYPTENALNNQILPEMQDGEQTGFINYRKFEKTMLNILSTKEWEPDSSDIVLQAFRTIDTENKGYLSEGMNTSCLV